MKQKLITLKTEFKAELIRLLDYWADTTIDNEFGGFVGEIDSEENVVPKASKSAVLNGRILWTFSAAYNFTKETKYLDLADRAYRYFISHFWDKKNGGVYWELDYAGNPVNPRKQAYAQGFAIYGFSEYFKASKKKESLKYAIKLFELVEAKLRDDNDGGYIEALTEDWSPMADMRLSEKDANEPKSMNTHLHIIEPYSNLHTVWPDKKLKERIKDLLEIFLYKIVNQQTGHLNLFLDMDWTVRSTIVSFGHDIEAAWLLTEAAHAYGDKEFLKTVEKTSLRLVENTFNKGLDEDGGLFYEEDKGHLDTDKQWWPQAEAMVGFMDAYAITGDEKYLESLIKSWEFIKNNIIDPKGGEWYWRVDKDGTPNMIDCKVGFWKCPYHNSRTLIEMITRIEKIM